MQVHKSRLMSDQDIPRTDKAAFMEEDVRNHRGRKAMLMGGQATTIQGTRDKDPAMGTIPTDHATLEQRPSRNSITGKVFIQAQEISNRTKL